MKKMFFLAAAIVFASVGTSVMAQNPHLVAVGGTFANEITAPKTQISVELVIEKQDIVAGPYARYAQKFLGVAAPLTDKVIYNIKSAKIAEDSDLQSQENVKSAASESSVSYPPLTLDKMSIEPQTVEESARAAAENLFKIRKSRLELITGDVGERVFGVGLKYALNELARQEAEYFALFFGRQTASTTTHNYSATPAKGVQTYTLCRFSQTEGLMAEDDMSGTPLLLELKKSGTVSTEGFSIAKRPKKFATLAYHIAADVQCRLLLDGNELTVTDIPLFEFGETIYAEGEVVLTKLIMPDRPIKLGVKPEDKVQK